MISEWLHEFLLTGETSASWQVLAQEVALADPLRAKVFDITPHNVAQVIQERSHLLKSVLPAFSQFCPTNLQIPHQAMLQVLWDLWLPLGIKIASSRQNLGRPYIQGILGGQGTGKTTMCQVLGLILQQLGYYTLSLSLDDLYKTYGDRLALTQQDPRLIWRGPPGTHDIDLGLSLLDQIRQGNSPVTVPRFDKSAYSGAGDRTTPEIVTNVDIVLFEGWFVGVLPIDPQAFTTAPPPIITDDDRAFARDMNHQLQAYLPLWKRLDSLIALDPSDYRCSLAWRKQAERKMIAAGKSGMSDAEIEEFVNYFWRSLHPELFIKPLLRSPKVDLVVKVDADHSFASVYNHWI
ncbi:glycerate kinase [Anabaena sphaerica FACHB-251]|uniref:Glycerate kinase n=1 Tax=Anabaena sphaerica FACHB-251 TaxID=2692883 RepID=A0A926WEF1_9NOST|nr:glycerate kinase [Anabaena sphaerica]MBD2291926.1 glycerate kinase [Anabaena sphaerica FACHB-251]